MNMKIYNVLWQDRHSDTTATPFLDLGEAKKYAYNMAAETCRSKDDLKVRAINEWLYYIEYSCEGDCLWITEHEV